MSHRLLAGLLLAGHAAAAPVSCGEVWRCGAVLSNDLTPARCAGANDGECDYKCGGKVRAERNREGGRCWVELRKSAERREEGDQQARGEDGEWGGRPEERKWSGTTPAGFWCVNGALKRRCTAQSDQTSAERKESEGECEIARPCNCSEEECAAADARDKAKNVECRCFTTGNLKGARSRASVHLRFWSGRHSASVSSTRFSSAMRSP